MANPYDMALRARAVAVYEGGEGSYADLAAVFTLDHHTLERWVARMRETGSVAPHAKGGGWRCPIDLAELHAVVRERPDGTSTELCRAYNRRVRRAQRTTPTSFRRAMRRVGYVLKQTAAASEVDRPDVQATRDAYLRWVRRLDPKRLVFLDEAGGHIAMDRSHAWVQRGQEYVEARPMNWGDNLTLVGALRRDGWLTLSTK